MREAKYVEILDKGDTKWVKRIWLDTVEGGVYCVDYTDESRYLNNKSYERRLWEDWREIKEPTFVQFDTIEEAKVLKDKWIKDKTGGEYLITGFDDDNVLVKGDWMALWYLFEEFTYEGKPCGKIKE